MWRGGWACVKSIREQPFPEGELRFCGLCLNCFVIFNRRKRGEKGEVVETVEDVIVRKLTAERVEELKKMIKETQEKYRCVTEAVSCEAPESPFLKK